jgi:hypothetical protein
VKRMAVDTTLPRSNPPPASVADKGCVPKNDFWKGEEKLSTLASKDAERAPFEIL